MVNYFQLVTLNYYLVLTSTQLWRITTDIGLASVGAFILFAYIYCNAIVFISDLCQKCELQGTEISSSHLYDVHILAILSFFILNTYSLLFL